MMSDKPFTVASTDRTSLKKIPVTKDSPVLRTDFSNEPGWESICASIQEPVGDFSAYVDFISDPDFNGLAVEQLLACVPEDLQDFGHTFMFIVDHIALTHPDHPIQVVDLYTEPGRVFRVIPSEMWAVQNNLSIANMDFEDFFDAADKDGIFRGFPDP
jgi:hypothetical protein